MTPNERVSKTTHHRIALNVQYKILYMYIITNVTYRFLHLVRHNTQTQ